jgi:predicted CoA-binding protein
MSLFKKNKNKVVVKHYRLPEEDEAAFIGVVVSTLMSDELKANYYAFKNLKIEQYAVAIYLDTDNSDIVGMDTYEIINAIKDQIDMSQYQMMCDAVDEGIQYELNKNNSMFGDLGVLDKAAGQINDMVEKHGWEKMQQIAKLGFQEDIIKQANEEVKNEQNKSN